MRNLTNKEESNILENLLKYDNADFAIVSFEDSATELKPIIDVDTSDTILYKKWSLGTLLEMLPKNLQLEQNQVQLNISNQFKVQYINQSDKKCYLEFGSSIELISNIIMALVWVDGYNSTIPNNQRKEKEKNKKLYRPERFKVFDCFTLDELQLIKDCIVTGYWGIYHIIYLGDKDSTPSIGYRAISVTTQGNIRYNEVSLIINSIIDTITRLKLDWILIQTNYDIEKVYYFFIQRN